MYAKTGEDKDYSVLASVELKKLFPKKVRDEGHMIIIFISTTSIIIKIYGWGFEL